MKLGRYTLIRELGQGGMATAYLAEAPGGMKVVLKTPHIKSEEVNERLRDEARVGIRLAHPAVVETLDLFEHKGKPVLVVAFIDGVSIDDLRRHAPVAPAAVARVGWQIAQGLHAVHSASDETGRSLHMVHRDVTAPNVLIDKSGDARLIDLGIARSVENIAATEPGTIKGTVRYLAPELLQGNNPTPQSDLWGLGCVLFEAATGKPIHTGAPAQTMISILRTHPLELPAAEAIHPTLKEVFKVIFEPDHGKRISDGYELSEMFMKAEAELDGGEGPLSLAVIEAVAAKPPPGEARLPADFADDADDADADDASAPAAPQAPLSSAPQPAAPVPSAPPQPAQAMPTPQAPAGTSPFTPPTGSGPFAVPPAGVPATPFNTPGATSGGYPVAPPAGGGPATPHGGAPGFGASPPGSGLFQLPGDSSAGIPTPHTSGPAPAAPGPSFAPPQPPPPQPAAPPPGGGFPGGPNTFAGADDLEVAKRERSSSRLLSTSGAARSSMMASQSGPSPFEGIARKFITVVLVLAAIGLAWRFVVKPMVFGERTPASNVKASNELEKAKATGPSYEEIEKRRLLEEQRERIKNVPRCWKGDDGYKFVFTRGGRNVVVQKINDVPTRYRKKARCIRTGG